MKLRRIFLAVSLIALFGCSAEEAPGEGNLATVFPNTGYTGTSSTVLISGNITEWTANSVVDFGPGIAVDSVQLVGPSSVMATITVAPDAELGKRMVSVDNDFLKEGFDVAASLTLSDTRGTVAQGSILTVVVDNMNPTTVFDTTTEGDGLFTPISYPNFSASISGEGALASIVNVSPTQVVVTVFIDVGAETGPRDLTLNNGAEGAASSLLLGSFMDVQGRSAEAFPTSTSHGTQSEASASRLYSIDASAGDIDLVNLAVGSLNESASMAMVLLGPSGSFEEFLGSGEELSFINMDARYLIVFDRGTSTGFEYTINFGATNLGALNTEPSSEGNETSDDAMATNLPSITSAALTSEGDVDFFKLTVAEPTMVTVQTQGGDQFADPILSVFSADNMDEPIAAVDNDYHETITEGLEPGDYYIKVEQSDYFPYDAEQTGYNLLVTGAPML